MRSRVVREDNVGRNKRSVSGTSWPGTAFGLIPAYQCSPGVQKLGMHLKITNESFYYARDNY